MESKRYTYCDYYGMTVGLHDTNNLDEAIVNANEFHHEVLDKQNGNQPVYSVWDGWNEDWRKSNEKERIY